MSDTQFARVYSAQPHHTGGKIVTVEIDIARGLHAFSIIGLGDKAIEESRDRVGAALRHTDFPSPKHQNEKTIVSLAPASLKKEGVYFDLAIALGYLIAKGELASETLNETICFGELGLDGAIKPVTGAIALAIAAQHAGYTTIICPRDNFHEVSLVPGLQVTPATSLQDLIKELSSESSPSTPEPKQVSQETTQAPCFTEIKGQDASKRALMIAAAGNHNILMYGPPGTGKSMMARALVGILPPLSPEESLAVTTIHSIAGKTINHMLTQRPIETPHHTSSSAAILGGGTHPKPGAITLAHHGVLFLDEFPEFNRQVLEGLRQPLEDRVVHIARARGKVTFPANIMLVAAMNPPDPNATPSDIRRLERKLSGPMMDRIDLWTNVEHVSYETLASSVPSGQTSTDIRSAIVRARITQHERQKHHGHDWPANNSLLSGKHINQLQIAAEATEILRQSAEKLKLSPRGYHRIIKVAQTIADLEKSTTIETAHILEALAYRSKKDAATTPYST